MEIKALNFKGGKMLHKLIGPIITLAAGVLILIFPEVLNFIVAFYLMLIGILGIIASL